MLSTDDIHNFADDNTITALSETIQDVINALQNKTERAIKWIENNNMITKPDKFNPILPGGGGGGIPPVFPPPS